jgi:hypothetical protein
MLLLHAIVSLWFHPSIPIMGRKSASGALNGPEHFSQDPHYIHDEMIDASPGLCLTNCSDSP